MTQVRFTKNSKSTLSAANVKKCLLDVVNANNIELFGKWIKVGRTILFITDLGNNIYNVKRKEYQAHKDFWYHSEWEMEVVNAN